jgi:hypothetical protein
MATLRRWSGFSLRVAIGLIVICAVVLALATGPAHRRRLAISEIRAAGGRIQLRPESVDSWVEPIVVRLLGPDAASEVYAVDLRKAKVERHLLERLRAIPEMGELDLEDSSFNEADLDLLRPLVRLRSLRLGGTGMTDAGLAKLVALPLNRLDMLSIQGTKVTDAGLVEVAKLSGLTNLWLNGTTISDRGLENLAPLTKLEDIGLRGTLVTSQGMEILTRFPKLTAVRLYRTSVDDEGVENLSKISTLRHLDLGSTRITDAALRSMARLPNLESFDITNTQISTEAWKAYRQAHPKCRIEASEVPAGPR